MARVILLVALAFIGIAVSAAFFLESNDENEGGIIQREKRFIFGLLDVAACWAKNLIVLGKCCGKPIGPFFNTSVNARCNLNKTNAALFRINGEYILNTYTSTSGVLDLSKAATVLALGPSCCLVDCIFRNQGFYKADNVSIDYDAVTAKLSMNVNEEWKPILAEVIKNCTAKVEAAKVKTIKVGRVSCSTKPALLVQCIRQRVTNVSSCPAALSNNSTYCQQALGELKSCPTIKLPIF